MNGSFLATALLIIGVGATAIGCRGAFIAFLHRVSLPPTVRHALRFVPPAAFAALVAPELLLVGGRLSLAPEPKLVAALVAATIAWRTRNAAATIIVGMIVFYAVRFGQSGG